MTPDFEASPEVLTWIWMLRGVVEGGDREARPRLSCVAFLAVSTDETRKRFGI